MTPLVAQFTPLRALLTLPAALLITVLYFSWPNIYKVLVRFANWCCTTLWDWTIAVINRLFWRMLEHFERYVLQPVFSAMLYTGLLRTDQVGFPTFCRIFYAFFLAIVAIMVMAHPPPRALFFNPQRDYALRAWPLVLALVVATLLSGSIAAQLSHDGRTHAGIMMWLFTLALLLAILSVSTNRKLTQDVDDLMAWLPSLTVPPAAADADNDTPTARRQRAAKATRTFASND